MVGTESIFRKLLPLLLLVITTIVSISLVASRDRRSIGSFNNFVRNSRDTSALIVQVLASALGLCQVYAICSTLNFSTRLHLQKRSVPLQTLNFWSALVTLRFDFSLPKWSLATLVIWCIMTGIPGALWAGALTPLFVPVFQDVGGISVPTYPLNASYLWDYEFVRYSNGETTRRIACTKTIDHKYQNWTGPFISSCPDLDFASALIASTGSASQTSNSSPWVHPNLIKPDWSFIGRSYGVGSSPGIMDPSETAPISYSAYNYTEIGYLTNVTCIYNSSASYRLVFLGPHGTDTTKVGLWATNGTLPNSVPGSFESYPLTTNGNDELLAWSAVVNNGRNLIAIAAREGSWYHKWNNMQCSVEFQPSLFAVTANLTSKTTTVTRPLELQSQVVTDIEPTGNLTAGVMLALDRLCRMSNNIDISVLGTAISWNVVNVQHSNPNLTTNETNIRALEDSITALLDNLLFAYGAVELALAGASQQTPFSGYYLALKVGSDKYIFATLGINIALLILLVAEAARTSFWKRLTKFNYTDVQRVVVATSAGGKGIANNYSVTSAQQPASRGRSGGGYRLDDDMAPVLVKLVEHDTGVVLTTGDFDHSSIELLL